MSVDLLEQEIRRLRKQYEARPNGRAFAPLADGYRKAGRLDAALELCHEGLNFHPNYSSAHVILGKIHLDRNDLDEARAAFERVVALDPDNLVALRHLATDATFREEQEIALDYWSRVLSLDPFDEEAEAEVERLNSADSAAVTTEAEASESSELEIELDDTPGAEEPAEEDGPELVTEETTFDAVSPQDETETSIDAEEADLQVDDGDDDSVEIEPEFQPSEPIEAASESTEDEADSTTDDQEESVELEVEADSEIQEDSTAGVAFEADEEIPAEVTEEAHQADSGHETEAVAEQEEDPREDESTFEPVEPAEAFAEDREDGASEAQEPVETPDLEVEDEDVEEHEEVPQFGSVSLDDPIDEPIDEPQPVAPAAGGGVPGASDFATMTLADIYYEQGFHDKALAMYKSVYERSPESPGLREKIESIENSQQSPAVETQPASPVSEASDTPVEVLSDGDEPASNGDAEALPVTEPVDEEEAATFDHFRNWLNQRAPRG